MNHHNYRESSYLPTYKAADIYVPIRHYICRGFSTNQLLFMQNKPNFKYAQINENSYVKSKYEKLDTWLSGKNKPNSRKTQNERKTLFHKRIMKMNHLPAPKKQTQNKRRCRTLNPARW